MRIKTIEKLKFKLTGRSIPVIKCMDVEKNDGRINTIQFLGECRDNQNTIHSTWDDKGWEKDPAEGKPVLFINESGIKTLAYIVSESGKTVNLYTTRREHPNSEETIGKLLSWDVLAMAMDMNRSMRNIMIGLFFGIGLGAFIIGPMIQAMLK